MQEHNNTPLPSEVMENRLKPINTSCNFNAIMSTDICTTMYNQHNLLASWIMGIITISNWKEWGRKWTYLNAHGHSLKIQFYSSLILDIRLTHCSSMKPTKSKTGTYQQMKSSLWPKYILIKSDQFQHCLK